MPALRGDGEGAAIDCGLAKPNEASKKGSVTPELSRIGPH